MGQTITSRLPDELNHEIEKIAKIEHLDKSSIVRRLLANAIEDWNITYAIKLFQEEKISLGRAVELSKISIWAFLEKLHDLKIPLHYDSEEFAEDLKILASGEFNATSRDCK